MLTGPQDWTDSSALVLESRPSALQTVHRRGRHAIWASSLSGKAALCPSLQWGKNTVAWNPCWTVASGGSRLWHNTTHTFPTSTPSRGLKRSRENQKSCEHVERKSKMKVTITEKDSGWKTSVSGQIRQMGAMEMEKRKAQRRLGLKKPAD